MTVNLNTKAEAVTEYFSTQVQIQDHLTSSRVGEVAQRYCLGIVPPLISKMQTCSPINQPNQIRAKKYIVRWGYWWGCSTDGDIIEEEPVLIPPSKNFDFQMAFP